MEARGLGYTWPSGRRGVTGVDLEVRPGERVAVLGPNGSGKSTLLRLLSGEIRPTSGSTHVLGRPPGTLEPPLRRRIGVASDHPVHLDALSGRRNALIFARARGMAAGPVGRRVDELMERFELTEAADVPVEEYSLGMRRKLLLVETLVHEPEVLLLDEPTLGLDPPAVGVLADLLGSASAHGAAAVLATNDVATAPSLADRVVFLHEGRVVADAPPAELLAGMDTGTTVRVEFAPPTAGEPDPVSRLGSLSADLHLAHVRTTAEGLVARVPGGSGDVPDLLAALVREGVPVRRLEIREPDLGDVFLALTGREIGSRKELP